MQGLYKIVCFDKVGREDNQIDSFVVCNLLFDLLISKLINKGNCK